MGVSQAGNSHHAGPSADARWLLAALLVNVAFMAVEVVAGLLANSLALLSDAAHMLTDAFAIGLALIAVRLAQRPPSGSFTFGLKRGEILSAQANGVLLLVLAGMIGIEAVARMLDPPDVDGVFVLWTGVAGAGANGLAAWFLAKASRESLNVRGAWLHNLFDMLASATAALAGLAIVLGGWNGADGLAALAVSLLMVHGGWGLVRDSGRVLLEGAPKGLDPAEIGRAMAALPGVEEIHDLHVWEVTSGFPALSAHAVVARGEDCHQRRRDLAELLHERFGLDHTTLQVEHSGRLLAIEPRVSRDQPV